MGASEAGGSLASDNTWQQWRQKSCGRALSEGEAGKEAREAQLQGWARAGGRERRVLGTDSMKLSLERRNIWGGLPVLPVLH